MTDRCDCEQDDNGNVVIPCDLHYAEASAYLRQSVGKAGATNAQESDLAAVVHAAVERAWIARFDKRDGKRGGPDSFYAGVVFATSVVFDALRDRATPVDVPVPSPIDAGSGPAGKAGESTAAGEVTG